MLVDVGTPDAVPRSGRCNRWRRALSCARAGAWSTSAKLRSGVSEQSESDKIELLWRELIVPKEAQSTPKKETRTMRILALGLGKYKTVWRATKPGASISSGMS